MKIWQMASGQEVCTLRGHHSFVGAVCVLHVPDGSTLVSSGAESSLKMWGREHVLYKMNPSAQLHDTVVLVSLSSDGKLLACVGRDRDNKSVSAITLWELTCGKTLRTLESTANARENACENACETKAQPFFSTIAFSYV